MKLYQTMGVSLAFAAFADAHFGLIFPKGLQTTPEDEGNLQTLPCATFDPNTPGVTFSNYPWQGSAIHVATTHPKVTWVFNVALLSQYPNFISMAPNIGQTEGTGDLCFGQVPGKKEYIGQKSVIQIIQEAGDGNNIQCAGVIFTDGPPNLVADGPDCRNASYGSTLPTDQTLKWLPGTGSDGLPPTPSSSVSIPLSQPGASTSGPPASSFSSGTGLVAPNPSKPTSSAGSSIIPTSVKPSPTGSGSHTIGHSSVAGSAPTSTASSKCEASKPSCVTGSNGTISSDSSPATFTGGSGKIELVGFSTVLGFFFIGLFALNL